VAAARRELAPDLALLVLFIFLDTAVSRVIGAEQLKTAVFAVTRSWTT